MIERLSELLSRSWVLAGCAAIVAAAYLASHWRSPPDEARTQFLKAATKLGITEAKRTALRNDLQQALLEMERYKCEENQRLVAGQIAVAYYETLLEKPVVAANLHMTRRGICEVRSEKPEEPLALARPFYGSLRLPWDCMPSEWRTPLDLALQAKIEQAIELGLLTTEGMTGTLGVISKSWNESQFKRQCAPRTVYEAPSYPRNLPVLAAPRDSWDRRR